MLKQSFNMNDKYMMLQNICHLFYQHFNIHVLQCMRLYSDNTCVTFVAHETWHDLLSKHHMDIEVIEARLNLGFTLWSDLDCAKTTAVENLSTQLGIVGLADIVKVSTHIPGCYELYTFAVDTKRYEQDSHFYQKTKRTLIEFVTSIEPSFVYLATQDSRCNNKSKLCHSTDQAQEKRIEKWMKDHDYVHRLIGKLN